VAAVLEAEPALLDTFLAAGFTQLASSYARQTVARVVTLQQACQRTGRDADQFIVELNAARALAAPITAAGGQSPPRNARRRVLLQETIPAMSIDPPQVVNLSDVVSPPEDGIISRTVYQDDRLKAVMFGFGAGQDCRNTRPLSPR
jgi:hypothetical protein